MLEELQMRDRPQTVLATSYCWFLRVLAVVCLVSALIYWAQLLGISANGQWRFDVVEPRWRIVSTVLAIILPAAGLGLWLTQAWGVVLWLIAISIEIAIFGIWSDLYMERPNLVIRHAASFGIFLVIGASLFFQKRKADAARL